MGTLLNVGLWRVKALWLEEQNRAKLLISRKTGSKEQRERGGATPLLTQFLLIRAYLLKTAPQQCQQLTTKTSVQQLLEAP